ncbi:MAG: phosphate signaling complex protein PhoU [Bacteroidales bacterium]
MKYIEQELSHLKNKLIEMWDLTALQLDKSAEALLKEDQTIAKEVILRERIVNTVDLQIDSECENIIALYAPVAIDLRFVLAMMRISNDLERIADFCEGIAVYVLKCNPEKPPVDLMQLVNLKEMLQSVRQMLLNAKKAFEEESSYEAIRVFDMDQQVDEFNVRAVDLMGDFLKQNPERGKDCLLLYGVVRRLERLGDHCTNIAEELIFYLDAKVLRHKDKKE